MQTRRKRLRDPNRRSHKKQPRRTRWATLATVPLSVPLAFLAGMLCSADHGSTSLRLLRKIVDLMAGHL